MKSALSEEFDFLKKTGRPASFGDLAGPYPFFTSSQEVSKRTGSEDCVGPALVFGTGGGPSIHYVDGPFSATNDCYVVVPKSGLQEDAKYFYHYLLSNIHLLEEGFRGAGLKHISKKYLLAIDLPTDERIDRGRISAIMDKADSIRSKRKQAQSLAEDLIKSTYMHLLGFGHPDYNSWEPFSIEALAEDRKGSIRSGPFGSALRHSEFVDEGIAVLGIDNAVKNRFQWADRRFITEKKYQDLKRYTVFPDDVIVTIMGTTGRSAVVPADIPEAITTKHLATITCNKKLIHPEVLSYAIHSDPSLIRQVEAQNKGAIMNGLNLGIIRKLMINRPPMENQLQFVSTLKKVRSLYDEMTTSNGSGEALLGSLSQRAFRGEL